ncbi:MAG: helix-turn-helix domain-containing protein [Actinobacteria bacterium]|nr:helix-turn-helix domain-containing protein [Actinomycetota bacterium]
MAGRSTGRPGAAPPADPAERLRARAARFAAVGEPVRLAIVEHLALGDAAPSELGALVDLPSNLLAHHLKVLEEAGLVRRIRSEGDRRRSYVRLRLEDPAVATLVGPRLADVADLAARLGEPGAAGRVVFVCTHNSARSQLAAAAWERVSDLPATSAGTRPAARVPPRAVSTARRHGLRLAGRRPQPRDAPARHGDRLVAVCDNAYEDLDPAGDRPGARLHWSVPDPVRVGTDAAFETAYDDIDRRVRHLAGTLGRQERPT